MYQVAHNVFIDHFRRQIRSFHELKGYDLPEQADDAPGPEAAALATESALRFRYALERLPPEQREAFLLHEEAGLTLADIAAVTATNEETVKSRLRYAVKKLRAAFAAERDIA